MSNSIKEVFNKFKVRKRISVRTEDMHKTSVILAKPLCDAATNFCVNKGTTVSELCRMIDCARPKDLPRTEAIRIVFSQLYFDPEGFQLND